MAITVSESQIGLDHFKTAWANMVEAIEPDVDSLPEPWKGVFKGPITLLISSKISLGIIPQRQLWPMIEKANYIYSLLKYPEFVDYSLDYISIEIGEFFTMLGIGMSIDGKFVLEGPMSRQFSTSTQTSRIVGLDNKGRETTYMQRV